MSEPKSYREKKGSRGGASFTNKPKASGRRPLNRFELESPQSTNVSTSAKKLKLSEDLRDVNVDCTFGYRILNLVSLFSAISEKVVCKTCKSNVKFTESGMRGLGFKVVVSCENCNEISIPSCPYIKNGYEINRRIIFAMRLLGIGLHGIEKFCAFMDMPRPIFHSFYDKLVKTIQTGTELVCQDSMKRAVQTEKENMKKEQTNGVTISGDGSWRKRGYSSLFGFVSLIGWFTGKVIDICVKSKYCKACEFWKKKTDTEEYAEWFENHANECEANHEGSAGKMEVDAVIEMFQRSEELHDVKYANYIGDGDSKTFKGILDAQPYENFIVTKKECLDHVQKRMGTRLRNLKKSVKGLGGKGKLTGKLIDELSVYYGLAIRRNTDSIEKMKNDIWATLYHKMSTNENPQHTKCPSGEDSWCSWQKAKATNTLEDYQHKLPLPQIVFDSIKPIYEELSSNELLNRCVGGYTQNSNESFNATVWNLAPKSVSSGKHVLDMASNIAVCVYNDGLTSIMRIMEVLGITIGTNCYNFCMVADERRIVAAERSLTPAAREARLSLKSFRKEEEEKNLNLEGQLYGPGIAD